MKTEELYGYPDMIYAKYAFFTPKYPWLQIMNPNNIQLFIRPLLRLMTKKQQDSGIMPRMHLNWLKPCMKRLIAKIQMMH